MATEAITIRPLTADDANEATRICFEAFNRLHDKVYGKPLDFTSIEVAAGMIGSMFAKGDKVYAVAAVNAQGKLLGSNFIDMSDDVATIGPISVDPTTQSAGAGRKLMESVVEQARKRGFRSIRLVQEVANLVSFSLYAKLGFHPVDQLTVLAGTSSRPILPLEETASRFTIRKMTGDDVAGCNALHKKIVGSSRAHDISDSLSEGYIKYIGQPYVAISANGGAVVGYATSFSLVGHLVAEDEQIASALHYVATRTTAEGATPIVKVMGRLNPGLLTWGLNEGGLKLQRQLTLMALDEYTAPIAGGTVYCPAIGY